MPKMREDSGQASVTVLLPVRALSCNIYPRYVGRKCHLEEQIKAPGGVILLVFGGLCYTISTNSTP